MRAPASGREVVLALDNPPNAGDRAYYDRVTGERLECVGKLVPLSSSPSTLLRSPQNLRLCPFCEELVGLDLSDCPHCRRRMPAIGAGGS